MRVTSGLLANTEDLCAYALLAGWFPFLNMFPTLYLVSQSKGSEEIGPSQKGTKKSCWSQELRKLS